MLLVVFVCILLLCLQVLEQRGHVIVKSLMLLLSCYILSSEFWKQIPPNEPYRIILADVRDKIYNTRERARQLLSDGFSDVPEEATLAHVDQVCFQIYLLLFISLSMFLYRYCFS